MNWRLACSAGFQPARASSPAETLALQADARLQGRSSDVPPGRAGRGAGATGGRRFVGVGQALRYLKWYGGRDARATSKVSVHWITGSAPQLVRSAWKAALQARRSFIGQQDRRPNWYGPPGRRRCKQGILLNCQLCGAPSGTAGETLAPVRGHEPPGRRPYRQEEIKGEKRWQRWRGKSSAPTA
jgi:hypothetical protein